jgi:hypothetical protein
MSQRQATNICFYGNGCKWSKAFLQELSQTPWKSEFRYICVDPSPNRPALPEWLKKVPTLVISGEPEPRTDGAVMNWIYEKKMKEAVVTTSRQTNSVEGSPGGEPAAYSMFENTSFNKSFGYSFNSADTSTGGDGGSMIPGTFSFLNGNAAPGDRNSQEFPGSTNQTARTKSKKEEMFDKQMEAYQRSREEGMPKGPARQ